MKIENSTIKRSFFETLKFNMIFIFTAKIFAGLNFLQKV